MSDIEKLLPSLPPWVSIPIILLTVGATLWPKLVEMFRAASSWRRMYEREKLRLELLKLRYEIEAIKKEKSLETFPDEGSILASVDVLAASAKPEESPRPGMIVWKRFAFGAYGAILPILLNFLLQDWRVIFAGGSTIFVILGYATRLILLVGLAGIASSVFVKKQATPVLCFLVGISVTLLLTTLLITASRSSPVPLPPKVSSTVASRPWRC